jgi:hypothetical protein
MRRTGALLISTMLLAGCASKSSDVTASYVTPLQYQSFTCEQIGGEATRVSSRVAELSGVQDDKATNDAIATGVAIVVFWPAAFLVSGDGQTAAELGRLKGEFQALEQASIQKNCGFQFQQQQPPPQAKPAPQQQAQSKS